MSALNPRCLEKCLDRLLPAQAKPKATAAGASCVSLEAAPGEVAAAHAGKDIKQRLAACPGLCPGLCHCPQAVWRMSGGQRARP